MASVKTKFRPAKVKGKEGVVYYQIIHNRKVRQIHTDYKLYPEEWDVEHSKIAALISSDEERNAFLASLRNAVKLDLRHINDVIRRLDASGDDYTTEQIVELYKSMSSNEGFIHFTKELIRQMAQIGKSGTAERYTTTLRSFARFCHENEVALENVDSRLMIEYEAYLKKSGVCQNTSSYYMRNLRAIYNRAVEQEITIQRFPFRHVYTGIDKTVKRAVPLNVIRKLRNWDLSLRPQWAFARDMFMFSFYTRGMSIIDLAYLKKKDLQNGILTYRRHKTKQQLFIKWERPMQDIVSRYDTSGSIYLLPIIRSEEKDERRQYINAAHLINEKLKKMGEELKLSIPLTTYVARHSWASIAKSKNVALATISEAMGHDSENTTRIYLASLDTSVVDKANSMIIELL